jgi:quinol monooxygenase YgiN
MIHHIVFWTLKNPAEAPRFKALLDGCASVVPGIHTFEVAIRSDGLEANVDVALVSAFTDAAALQAYQQHPRHQAVAAELGAMRAARHVMDFERA